MKVLITGGGTGGHLYPALAVAEALKFKIGSDSIVFVGAKRGLEAEEVPAEGYTFRGLETVGFPRKLGLGSIKAAAALFRSILEARRLLKEFDPAVVFSTGGYASAPVVVAAWLRRVPLVLQEQNSVPGRTNSVASRFASEVHLAFPSARRFFPKRRHLRLSGNPLRAQVLEGSRSRALRQFRLDEERFTVLVLGGSQGSHAVNQAIVDVLGVFAGREDIQFLIQSGERDHEWMVDRCRDLPAKTWVRRFIPNMGDAYELADLVVGRAGAMTISEVTACGLPSILVPYPYATGDHQRLNAEMLQEVGASVMIPEDELTGAGLAERIAGFMADPRALRQMALAAHRLARPEAAQRLVAALVRYLPGVEISESLPGPAAPRPAPEGGRRDGPDRNDPRREAVRTGGRDEGDRGPSRGAYRSDRSSSDGGRDGRDRDGRRPHDGRRQGSHRDDRPRRDAPYQGGGSESGRRSGGRGGGRRGGNRGGGGPATGSAAGAGSSAAGPRGTNP